MDMRRVIAWASMAAVVAACGNKGTDFDVTGTFEATEVTVSAEQNGCLLRLDVQEGDKVSEGVTVGLIDTVQTWLKIKQVEATKAVYQSQKPDMEKQIAATREQLAKARMDQQRYRELVADGAAPAKAKDDADSQVQVLERQLEAQMSTLGTSTRALEKQMEAADVQMGQLYDQLRKCHVSPPTDGIILEKYAECGEYVAPGKPLFKLADMGQMFIRAYVTSAQLADVKLGQTVKVFADYGNGDRREYEGTVSWISARSEFTPKTILTDDERADLVYAMKVAIRNDGYLKIGMYGEVKF